MNINKEGFNYAYTLNSLKEHGAEEQAINVFKKQLTLVAPKIKMLYSDVKPALRDIQSRTKSFKMLALTYAVSVLDENEASSGDTFNAVIRRLKNEERDSVRESIRLESGGSYDKSGYC